MTAEPRVLQQSPYPRAVRAELACSIHTILTTGLISKQFY